MLRLRLLGPFALLRADSEITDLTLRDNTSRTLLKCLALHSGQAVPREVLVEWLWPGSAPAAGLASLRAAISHLRRSLEPQLRRAAESRLILRRPPGYLFRSSELCTVDLELYKEAASQAEQQAAAGDWPAVLAAAARAEDLVQGDLLACEPFAEWAAQARAEFCNLRAGLLELALLAASRLGCWETVRTTAATALGVDPLREGFYRHLMAAYAALGEPALALSTFDRCRRVLAEELGADPSAATMCVYAGLLTTPGRATAADQIAAATADQVAPPPPAAPRAPSEQTGPICLDPLNLPLVGRRKWLELLPARLRAGGLIVISGDPGVGKTRLAAQLLQTLARDGVQVLKAQCNPLEHGAFQPLAEALGPLWPTAAAAAPLPAGDDDWQPSEETQVFSQCLARLQQIARQRPVVLFLDDLHWADQDTLAFVSHLLRQGKGQPLTVLATLRLAELADAERVRSLLAQARRAGHLTEAPLTALTEADLLALLQPLSAEAAAKTADLARQLYNESGGNPLFAVERLRELLAAGILQPASDGRWRWDDHLSLSDRPLLTPALELLQERVADLSEPALRLLQTAALLGGHAPFRWLCAACRAEPRDLLNELDELLSRRLLMELPRAGVPSYGLGHHLIQEAVVSQLSAARKTEMHRQIGQALAELAESDTGVPPAQVAQHLLLAGEQPAALDWLQRTARAARAAHALREAAAYAERALALATELGLATTEAQCAEDLADVLWNQGARGQRLTELYRRSLAHAPEVGDRCRRRLKLVATYLGVENDLAIALAEQTLELAESANLQEYVGPALQRLAMAHFYAADYEKALQLQHAALTAYNARGDEADAAAGHLIVASIHQQMGNLEASRTMAVAAAARFEAIGHAVGQAQSRMKLAEACCFLSRWPEALQWGEAAVLQAEQVGLSGVAGWARLYVGWAHHRLGNLAGAAAALQAALNEAENLDAHRLRIDAQLFLAAVRADQGDIAAAKSLSAQAMAGAAQLNELMFAVIAAAARAYVLWQAGETAGALQAARHGLELGRGKVRHALVYVLSVLGEIEVDLGLTEAALNTAAQLLVVARKGGLPFEEAIALRIRGRALLAAGQAAAGAAELHAAAERLRDLGAALEVERTEAMLSP